MKTGYYLRNKNGNLILSPFQDPANAPLWEMEEKVQWIGSGDATSENMEELDKLAYDQIDRGIKSEREEANYYPRLFISAGVFIAVYFILSFAIRDPIPVLDELLFASLATFATWTHLKKRNNQGELALKKTLELKARLNEATFDISPEMGKIEAYLEKLSTIKYLDLADMIIKCHGSDLAELEAKIDHDFLKMLNYYLKEHYPTLYSKIPAIKVARADDNENVRLSAYLVNQAHKKGKNLSLLAFYIAADEEIVRD